MLIGIVEGNVVSTIKHGSLTGWRVLVIQPVGAGDAPDGDPVLAVDSLGAGRGSRVVISSDGRGTRELLGDNNSPVRWTVTGIVDE